MKIKKKSAVMLCGVFCTALTAVPVLADIEILYTHYRSWHPAVLSSIIKISLMKQALPFLLHGLKFRKQHRRSKINSVMTFIHGVLI